MRVGLLTGGGDCPGLNAVIRAVTRSLIRQCNAEVIGINDGFAGLMEKRTQPLTWDNVGGLLGLGGTILGTTNRLDPLQSEAATQRALDNAQSLGLDAVVAMGGDGTMTIAHGLAQRGLKVVGVPKTIDNDIEGCSYNDGSMTKTKQADHCCTMRDASLSSSSSSLMMSSDYHLIGHDLRSSPDSLF